MSNFESAVSVCRHCRSYHLEGRRGGYCTQLGSPVQGCWSACPCAAPPFAPSWEAEGSMPNGRPQRLWETTSVVAMAQQALPSDGDSTLRPNPRPISAAIEAIEAIEDAIAVESASRSEQAAHTVTRWTPKHHSSASLASPS